MSHVNGWEVGMTVFVAYRDYRSGTNYNAKITNVGRKWITLDGGFRRFDAETMQLDGGKYMSPGKVYVSEDEYLQQTAVAKAWSNFKLKLVYSQAPADITVERISEIAREFGIEVLE